MEQIYGYVRVSTREQNENRQLDAMAEFGVPSSPSTGPSTRLS